MKHYCFATKEVGRRGKVKGRVWRIRDNKLEPITSFEFNYAPQEAQFMKRMQR